MLGSTQRLFKLGVAVAVSACSNDDGIGGDGTVTGSEDTGDTTMGTGPETTSATTASATTGTGTTEDEGGESRIWFQSERDSEGLLKMFIMNEDGSEITRLLDGDGSAGRWSGDGTQLAFVRSSGARDVFVVDMQPDVGTETQLTTDPANDQDPSWAPDGSTLVFRSDRAGNFDLYTIGVDGGALKRLTDSPEDDSIPRWSPTDGLILFGREVGGVASVFVIGSDGTGERQITDQQQTSRSPRWHPAGEQIVYVRGTADDQEIHVVHLGGTEDRQLTNNSTADLVPRWSPDGSLVSFIRDSRLYVFDASGESEAVLTPTEHTVIWVSWAPDSVRLAYQADAGGQTDIYVIDVQPGSEPTNLTAHPLVDARPEWSP